MQSSAVVTFRALVMLLCLLLVPLVAVFGSSVPQWFNSIVPSQSVVRVANNRDGQHKDLGDAPAFGAAPSVSAGGGLPQMPTAPAVGAIPGLDGSATLWAPPAATQPERDAPPRGMPPFVPPNTAGRLMPAPTPPPGGLRAAAPLPPAAPQSGGAEEPFRQIERRLRELGATYCLLETFGHDGRSYRFHCKISVAGDPHHARPFDATDEDPIRAMRQVLEHVEAWRAGSEP